MLNRILLLILCLCWPFLYAQKVNKRLPYGLKSTRKEKFCPNCGADVFNHRSVSYQIADTSVYLRIRKGDLPRIKNYFKHRKDGVTIEYVLFKHTYSCDAGENQIVPTRKNGKGEFDGPINRPLFKKQILKAINQYEAYLKENRIRLTKDETLQIYLGSVPVEVRDEEFIPNILVFKHRRLCKVMKGTTICGAPLLPVLPQLPYSFTPGSVEYEPDIKPEVIRFKVGFEQNGTTFTQDKVLEAVMDVNARNLIVSGAKLFAHASVEGTKEINERLFTKRAAGIMEVFEENQRRPIDFEVTTTENWKMFFQQIEGTEYAFLKDWDTLDIRKYVNDPVNVKKLEKFLSKERYVFVRLFVKPDLRGADTVALACLEFGQIISSGKELSAKKMQRLQLIQQFVLDARASGWQMTDSLQLDIPRETRFAQLLYNQLMFDHYYNKEDVPIYEFYEEIKELQKILKKNPEVRYNYLIATYNLGYHRYLDDLEKTTGELIRELRSRQVHRDTVDQFVRYLHHERINNFYSFRSRKIRQARESKQILHSYYQSMIESYDDLAKYQLAKYYLFMDQPDWAIAILEPLVQKEDYDHEQYATYLKCLFALEEERNIRASQLLAGAVNKLTDEEWCDLFKRPCNIDFQVFDQEDLRLLYCQKCREKK